MGNCWKSESSQPEICFEKELNNQITTQTKDSGDNELVELNKLHNNKLSLVLPSKDKNV